MKMIEYRRENKWEENGVTYNAFVSRINSWWSWKDAVSVKWRELHRKQYEKTRKVDESWYYIDIKYKLEEAVVFAVIYEDMIHEIEEKYLATDEPQEAYELIQKKKKLEKEYDVFLSAQV